MKLKQVRANANAIPGARTARFTVLGENKRSFDRNNVGLSRLAALINKQPWRRRECNLGGKLAREANRRRRLIRFLIKDIYALLC